MRILLIEDDAETASNVASALQEEGNSVRVSADGREGLFVATTDTFDLLIVDRMLPHLDGLSLVKRLRGSDVQTPVLFLTTMSGIGDRVDGLNAGGDDYLVKPFALFELTARVNALGRRPRGTPIEMRFKVADLELNVATNQVMRAGKQIALQPREFKILECLMRHAGQIVTRTMLLNSVWHYHFDPCTNVIESHLSRLRGKIDKGYPTELIQTIRGSGYSIRAPQ